MPMYVRGLLQNRARIRGNRAPATRNRAPVPENRAQASRIRALNFGVTSQITKIMDRT